LGKEVYQNQNQISNINIKFLKQGIYFLEINDGQQVFRKKFLKE